MAFSLKARVSRDLSERDATDRPSPPSYINPNILRKSSENFKNSPILFDTINSI